MKTFFLWLPRILAILFIGFISMFALDAFSQRQWPLALFMHLIPSFILVIMTVVAWKFKRVGGALFLAIGVLILVLSRFQSLIVTVPMIAIGVLFLVNGYSTHTNKNTELTTLPSAPTNV